MGLGRKRPTPLRLGAYARFVLLGHPAALSNCPVRGHPDDYEDNARSEKDDRQLLASDAAERAHFSFIMDPDVAPAERRRRILQVMSAIRLSIDQGRGEPTG